MNALHVEQFHTMLQLRAQRPGEKIGGKWSCIVSIGNIAHFTRQRMNGYIDNAEGVLRHFLNKAS